MLNDGWWLEQPYTKWQPSGCMPHSYTAQEVSNCLNHSRVLYVGDSIMREQFYSMTRHVRPLEPKGSLHIDRKYEAPEYGMTFEFWWDPFINSTRTQTMLNGSDPDNRPSLLVIGAGIWYMRHLNDRYFDEWRKAVDRVMDAVEKSPFVADAVMLSPVEIPQFNLLNAVRKSKFNMEKINRMNNYIRDKEPTLSPKTSFVIPFAWNAICSSTVNQTHDGLHYLPPVTTVQASLALNYRCNDLLPKSFPMADTCCMNYPTPAWYQNMLFVYFLIWIPIGFYVLAPDSYLQFMRRLYPTEADTLSALFVFGLGVLYMYLSDRTQLFGKALKSFDRETFGILMGITLLGGIVSLRRKKEGDQGFLSRAQTDEWKGWMQIIILFYHFTGASQTPGIYNAMRVLVAAYLFQTGYGHFFFFYKKADFGMMRVMNVLVRLNLLTVVLEYVMDTDYISYYFTPLVTFWFGVIWIVMYVGHAHNTKAWFLLAKMAVMGVLTGVFIHVPGILEGVFSGLEFLFNIHWDAVEWRFRLALDAWIVYIGMLFAYATILFNKHELSEHLAWPVIKYLSMVASVLGLGWYFWFELSCPTKAAYTVWHPYISWIPILSFVCLRNASRFLRNTTAGFYEFVGKCSLETFIGQFHMWLAADTKGLLVILVEPSWARGLGWWFNLAVSSCLFMLVCYHLSKATGTITKWICAAASDSSKDTSSVHRHGGGGSGAVHGSAATTGEAEVREDNVPLLPTTAEEGKEDEEADEWTEEMMGQQHQKPVWWRRMLMDLRVRAVLFLVSLGIINNLC
ncbi:10 TM acyl transferase domain found in Cas1p-domain-containing protein [Dichotomocladium elegans]|nr:10 TM acyl transferase domain found in Cas1p-domain-containing protein [Dichotomocladium elegans]